MDNEVNKDFSSHEYWDNICELFSKIKKYLLLIEELESEHATVMQPVKEQRDALDHIVRAYGIYTYLNNSSSDNEKWNDFYKEFERAKGHLERALNDSADILSIILRERISAYLSDFSYKEILSKWSDYPNERKFLIKVDEQISMLRNRKINSIEHMKEYDKIIDRLKDIYYKVTEDIYPKLCLG